MSPAQTRNVISASTVFGQSLYSVRSCTPQSISRKSRRSSAAQFPLDHPPVLTASGLPVLESACLDPTQWRIERISSNAADVCRGRFEGRRCNAKIARYRRAVVAPTFTGIDKHSRTAESQQVQFWFCPNKLQTCVLGGGCRWILYFPSVPLRWPVKFGSNPTQVEVSSFESVGFVLEDGIAKVDGESQSGTKLFGTKVISGIGTNPVDVPKSSFLSIPPSALKFSLGPSGDREGLFAFKVLEGGDGDKRPSIRNGKVFRFVPHPSTDHLKKIEEHRKLDCTILKYVKVPSPGYGAVLTVITPRSLDKKELYEVSISNFPACTCKSFK